MGVMPIHLTQVTRHPRKRQRTAAVQDASRFRGRVEPPPGFGLRQSSAAFIWLRTSLTDTFNRTQRNEYPGGRRETVEFLSYKIRKGVSGCDHGSSGTSFGVQFPLARLPGVSLALNPRLISGTASR